MNFNITLLPGDGIGLSEIDFRTIGNGKAGPVTRKIQSVYHEAIRGKLPLYESWCEYVG